MNRQIYSDLALESSALIGKEKKHFSEYRENSISGFKLCTLYIDSDELEARYKRPRGKYVTVICGKIQLFSDEQFCIAVDIIAQELKKMLTSCTNKKIDEDFSVLVAGLGNAEMTPDAIGPLTLSHLTVTRHIGNVSKDIFGAIGECKVSAVATGVLSQTGIETVEMIKGVCEKTNPDAVIAVDALAARSCERLAATVQISDSGIRPGSGIGNIRKAINKENLGIPVIALGVPTVVDSATLVYDALERAGIAEIGEKLGTVLASERNFFVSPKESDIIVQSISLLLARSLDKAFSIV